MGGYKSSSGSVTLDIFQFCGPKHKPPKETLWTQTV